MAARSLGGAVDVVAVEGAVVAVGVGAAAAAEVFRAVVVEAVGASRGAGEAVVVSRGHPEVEVAVVFRGRLEAAVAVDSRVHPAAGAGESLVLRAVEVEEFRVHPAAVVRGLRNCLLVAADDCLPLAAAAPDPAAVQALDSARASAEARHSCPRPAGRARADRALARVHRAPAVREGWLASLARVRSPGSFRAAVTWEISLGLAALVGRGALAELGDPAVLVDPEG